MKLSFSCKNIATRLMLFVLLAGFGGVESSCKKESQPVARNVTIYPYIMDQITAKSSYSLLNAALIRSGLDTLLKDKGVYTLLAPSDQALQSAGFTLAAINQLDKQRLYYMMKYLVLPGILRSDTLNQFSLRPDYPLIELWTMDSIPLPLTFAGGSLKINGNPLNMADSLPAANGVIFPLSSFPQAPAGTISQLLQQSGCAYMLAAINHSTLSPLFSSPLDTLALMAPTDQAFVNAGYPDTPSLIATGTGHLDSLVKAHLMYYHTSDQAVFGLDPVAGNIMMVPAGITRRWIVPGLVHNGSLLLTTVPQPYCGCFLAQNDIYVNTFLYQFQRFNGDNGASSGQYDLGYLSDGINYAFYRQRFINNDSATIGKVLTPNVSAINGLIHIIDHVLPQD